MTAKRELANPNCLLSIANCQLLNIVSCFQSRFTSPARVIVRVSVRGCLVIAEDDRNQFIVRDEGEEYLYAGFVFVDDLL